MTRKYPGDAVFEAAPEFSAGAADYAAEQRLERAREIAKQVQNVFFGSQFNPSDDTWAAIKVYRDGNPIVLDDGFKTQDEAEDCADLARDADLEAMRQPQLEAAE